MPYGLAGFQIYREAERDGFGNAAAGGANRLFSPQLSLRCCIAFPILSGVKQSMNFAVRFVAEGLCKIASFGWRSPRNMSDNDSV